MKKVIATLLGLGFLIGCVSFQKDREPAGSGRNLFRFDLYGGNPLTSAEFDFQLLDLKALPDKVQFSKYHFSEPQTERLLADWQELLTKIRKDNKEGFHFQKSPLIIDVDGSDMKNLDFVLKAIDQTEASPDLRSRKKVEAIEAFNERFRDPIERRIDVVLAPFALFERIATPQIPVQSTSQMSRNPSSFWSPRKGVNMWRGPGQFDFERLKTEICDYQSAKSGFGVHAGFKVKCLGEKLKAKFGNEAYSGPLNSRLYYRLGYNVPAIHFVPELKVRYDRRILAEFNSRKPNYIRLSIAGAPLKPWRDGRAYDVFTFIKYARTKDGRNLSGADLKQQMLRSCPQMPCDFSDSNVDASMEKQIDYLAFEHSSVTEPIGEEIGPWSYSRVDHPMRPEVRALLVLGAWTGNFDLRKDNTRLVWDPATGDMKHFISDPGSGLGGASKLFKTGSQIGDMVWSATTDSQIQNGDSPAVPVVNLSGLKELEANTAFTQVTFQDAQWMVRQIADVSEQELSEALAASGLSSAEYLLAREKLTSIRLKMIEDFKLKSEYQNQFRPIRTKMNFDPAKDHVDVRLSDGRTIRLENQGVRLTNGTLVYPSQANPQ